MGEEELDRQLLENMRRNTEAGSFPEYLCEWGANADESHLHWMLEDEARAKLIYRFLKQEWMGSDNDD